MPGLEIELRIQSKTDSLNINHNRLVSEYDRQKKSIRISVERFRRETDIKCAQVDKLECLGCLTDKIKIKITK